jgi:hypothetical protein
MIGRSVFLFLNINYYLKVTNIVKKINRLKGTEVTDSTIDIPLLIRGTRLRTTKLTMERPSQSWDS